MDFKLKKNNYIQFSMRTGFFLCVMGIILYQGACKKEDTEIKEKLMGHKIATLNDNLELMANGVNPLEGDKRAISNGGEHYAAMCVVCHGEGGQGSTGPDLLDDYWLHGSDNFSIYNTVMNGIPIEHIKMNPPRGKMPGYKNILGSYRVLELMAWLADQKNRLNQSP